jgi:hypothetical protein
MQIDLFDDKDGTATALRIMHKPDERGARSSDEDEQQVMQDITWLSKHGYALQGKPALDRGGARGWGGRITPAMSQIHKQEFEAYLKQSVRI